MKLSKYTTGFRWDFDDCLNIIQVPFVNLIHSKEERVTTQDPTGALGDFTVSNDGRTIHRI